MFFFPQQGRLLNAAAAANKHSKYYSSSYGSVQEWGANITASCSLAFTSWVKPVLQTGQY